MAEDFFGKSSPSPIKGEEKKNYISDDEVEKMMEETYTDSEICCMLTGKDGTGKTGIVLSALSDEDKKNGFSMWIIDLDAGASVLKHKYYKNSSSYKIKNPLQISPDEDGVMRIDYKKTLNTIRSIIRYVDVHHKEKKIKAIVFDGLSTFLSHAENIMRIEKRLTADGGVSISYWKIRAKIFSETLESIRKIPIDRYFIAHQDFTESSDGSRELPVVKQKVNQMMFQKINCTRQDVGDEIRFIATVIKSKTDISQEGKEIVFGVVNKQTGESKWRGDKVMKIFSEGN